MNAAVDKSVLKDAEPTTVLPPEHLTLLSGWLDAFEASLDRLALDEGFRLWQHYEGYDGQNRAALVLMQKLDLCLFVPVTAPAGALPVVDAGWTDLDEHRTLLLALCQRANARVDIVNTTHIGWHRSRMPAGAFHPFIQQILADWLDAAVTAAIPPQFSGQYKPPPKFLAGDLANATPVGVGTNGRKAWEDESCRYEWDYQHGHVEVYSLTTGAWSHESDPTGSVTKATGGEGRRWGR
jgi:hypothetical protein